jgi:hypothetical protein
MIWFPTHDPADQFPTAWKIMRCDAKLAITMKRLERAETAIRRRNLLRRIEKLQKLLDNLNAQKFAWILANK